MSVWKSRFNEIQASMSRTKSLFLQEEVHRQETLIALIDGLQQFTNSKLAYYFDELSRESVGANGSLSNEFMRKTLGQIGFDLNLIRQAHNERSNLLAKGNNEEGNTLSAADDLIHRALEPAIKAGMLSSKTTAIAYFQNGSRVRVVPYAPVALVSISYTCVSVAEDLLAIPHEAGHFLYWNGQYKDKKISNVLDEHVSKTPEWCYQWSEEIFTDVYSGLVGGPVVALSFQDLMLQDTSEQFVTNDGAHPISALRPFIYTKVLATQPKFTKWAVSLDSYWRGRLKQLGVENVVKLKDGEELLITDAISLSTELDTSKPVDNVITKVLELFGDSGVLDHVQNVPSWHDHVQVAETIQQLYPAFSETIEAVKQINDQLPPELPRDFSRPVLLDRLPIDANSFDAKNEVLAAVGGEGWSNEGPHSRNYP